MKGIGFDGTVSWNSFGARVLVSFVWVLGLGGSGTYHPPLEESRRNTTMTLNLNVCMIATTSSFI